MYLSESKSKQYFKYLSESKSTFHKFYLSKSKKVFFQIILLKLKVKVAYFVLQANQGHSIPFDVL